MSDAKMNPALEIEAQAAAWLDRRYLWNWDDESQAKLNAWLAQDTAHLVTYLRLEAAWMRIERLNALKHQPPMRESSPRTHRRWLSFGTIAAVFVVLAAAGIAAIQLNHPQPGKVYATPVGARETLAFSDGSQIELNTNTILRAEIAHDKRTAALEQGEAFFQIKHDSTRPFIVIAGKSRLIDLGTKFSVRRDGDRLQVTLMDGRVELQAATNAGLRKVTLSPGETALATPQGLSVTRPKQEELDSVLAWRKGVLMFQHTTLAAAVAEFNRYNERKIVIGDAAVKRLTINGTFPANDVEPFVEVAKAVFGLEAKKRDDEIVLTR